MVKITPGALAPQAVEEEEPTPPPGGNGDGSDGTGGNGGETGGGGGGATPPPSGIDVGLIQPIEEEAVAPPVEAIVIPWPGEFSSFEQTVTLDGRLFRLHARWNTSHEYWSMDIIDDEDSPLVTGLKIVLGVELLNRYNDPRLPPGRLLAVDMSGAVTRIGRNDLGDRVQLAYATV